MLIRIKTLGSALPEMIVIRKIESVQDLGNLRIIYFTSGRKVTTDLTMDEIEALITGEQAQVSKVEINDAK